MNAFPKRLLLLILVSATLSVAAAEAPKASAKPPPARSAFTLPTSPQEGRDPFFPNSMRPYADATPAVKRGPDASAFIIKGLSIDHGHAMVIINNHTFAVGDEGDVVTSNGRAHIRVTAINANRVSIAFGGETFNLTLANK